MALIRIEVRSGHTQHRTNIKPCIKHDTSRHLHTMYGFTPHTHDVHHTRVPCVSNPSRLRPRELEHYDPAIIVVRDVELVALDKDCSDTTIQINAKPLYDVA